MNAVTTLPARQPAQVQPQVLVPRTFEQLITFAEMAAASGLVPKDYVNKPGAVMLAVQMGSELGLSPMQSLTSIAVINGRPGVWGDGLIGLCRQSPLCQDIVETITGEGDERVAKCVATRRGSAPVTAVFSVADAKKAGLWGKDIWAKYPDRMLKNRARGFALRDAFPDVLRGLKTGEELLDTPPDTFRGTTLQAASAPETVPQRIPKQPQVSEPVTTPEQPRRTYRQLIDETAGMLKACDTVEAVLAVGQVPQVNTALERASPAVQAEIKALLADAYERVQALADDAARAEEPEDDFPVAVALEAEPAGLPA